MYEDSYKWTRSKLKNKISHACERWYETKHGRYTRQKTSIRAICVTIISAPISKALDIMQWK